MSRLLSPMLLLMVWAQTIPLVPLMYAPFGDGALRFRRRNCLLAFTGYFLLGCAGQAVVSRMASPDGVRNYLAQDLTLIAVILPALGAWAWIVKAPALHKLMMAGMVIHYAAVQMLASNLSALLIGDQERYINEIVYTEAGNAYVFFTILGVTAVTWPLVWLFSRRTLQGSLPLLSTQEARRRLLYICVMFLLFCFVSHWMPYFRQPFATVSFLSITLAEMLTYYTFFQEIATVRRQAETAQELAVWQVQYRQLSRAIEETRRLRHDMRHHLNALSALNAQGKQEEIAEYLKQYGTVYDQLEKQKSSGDPVVDSVLEYYLSQAREAGVAVECRASLPKGSGVDATDITVLLGNCLENALEAVRVLPPEERRLSVEIMPSGVVLLIRIINSCGDMPDSGDFAGWEEFSKAKGREGVGLRSVALIAEKYGGSAQFIRKDGEFTARVLLNCVKIEKTV